MYITGAIPEKPLHVANLPITVKQKLLSTVRITERMFRLEPRVVVRIDTGEYLLSFCGSLYNVDVDAGTVKVEHRYRTGVKNPLNISRIEGVNGFDDCIVYGEYWGNINREDVCIYVRKDSQWRKVYTFAAGTIQHIHNIIPDHYRNCVLIFTGDKDQESGIWVATDNFSKVEPLLVGKQRYRSCVAFPVEKGILYATDSPLEKNFIGLLSLEAGTWLETPLYDLPGPCIYGTKTGESYVFATSVEPDSRISGIRYFLTYRLGAGVRDRSSHVIAGCIEDGFREIASFKKDCYPMGLFQFGNVQFPAGCIKDRLCMYPIGVQQYDGCSVICDLPKQKVHF